MIFNTKGEIAVRKLCTLDFILHNLYDFNLTPMTSTRHSLLQSECIITISPQCI